MSKTKGRKLKHMSQGSEIKKLKSKKPYFLSKQTLVWVAGFAVIGVITLLISNAATSSSSVEPESDQQSGSVAEITDSAASGGGFVRFNAAAPPPTGNVFSDAFGDLSHWSFGHWTQEKPGHPRANSTGSIVNGRAVIVAADQNYGDATLRADRLYDVRSGGTFTFDVSLSDGMKPASGAFIGYPFVGFMDEPLNTPSYFDDNGKGTGPRNGGYYQFWHTCSIPWQAGHARQFKNYVETVMPGEDQCAGQVAITEGQMNRVELRYNGNNGWEFWASNAGTTAPLTRLRSFTMEIPEVGYFILGSHNHASLKYSSNTLATANATFDNVSYPAGGYSSSYRNGNNVVKGAAVKAHVSFSGYYADALTGPFSVTINGTTVQYTPFFHESRSFHAAVEVPVSAVRDGANTITIQGGAADVANLDIVLTRNTP